MSMRGARLNRATFEGVAAAIKRAWDKSKNYPPEEDVGQGVYIVAHELADDFEDAANNFDRELFLKNCGLEGE